MTWLEPNDDGNGFSVDLRSCSSPNDRQVMRDYTRRTGMEAWFAERRGEMHWAWAALDERRGGA